MHGLRSLTALAAFLMAVSPAHCFLPSFLQFGYCSDTPVQENLDVEKFAGLWYMVMWIPNEYASVKSCIRQNYTYQGDHLELIAMGLDKSRKATTRQTILRLEGENSPTFIKPKKGLRPNIPIKVVSTDYTSYACVYMCVQKLGLKGEFLWVLGRVPRLDPAIVGLCKTVLTEDTGDSGIDFNEVVTVEHGNSCPYWPGLLENHRTAQKAENGLDYLSSGMEDFISYAINENLQDSKQLQALLADAKHNLAHARDVLADSGQPRTAVLAGAVLPLLCCLTVALAPLRSVQGPV